MWLKERPRHTCNSLYLVMLIVSDSIKLGSIKGWPISPNLTSYRVSCLDYIGPNYISKHFIMSKIIDTHFRQKNLKCSTIIRTYNLNFFIRGLVLELTLGLFIFFKRSWYRRYFCPKYCDALLIRKKKIIIIINVI